MFSESTPRHATSAPLLRLRLKQISRTLSFAARTRACGRGIEAVENRPKLDHLAWNSFGVPEKQPTGIIRFSASQWNHRSNNHCLYSVRLDSPVETELECEQHPLRFLSRSSTAENQNSLRLRKLQITSWISIQHRGVSRCGIWYTCKSLPREIRKWMEIP